MKITNLLLAMFIFALISSSCKKKDDPIDPGVEDYDKAVISTGGIMYDKFWSTESGFDQNDPNMNTFNDHSNFFRCKQCHGWDGLGNKGAYINRAPSDTRPNVSSLDLFQLGKTKSPQELFDAMTATTDRRDISYDLSTYNPETNKTEGDKMPNLNQLLTDAQIWDLVKFMKEGMFDVTELYDATYEGSYPTGSMTISNVGLNGNAETGNDFYTENCMGCHGSDGTTLEMEGKTLGKFVRSKANEVQHKVKYGQLGSPMTGEFDITLTQMRDLYKACSDTEAFPDEAPIIADISIGGIMYDKFWSVESGFDQGNTHMTTFNASSNFFRCKQCHGWDGLGSNGAYISRAPSTTRPNVSSLNLYELAQTKTAQELFDGMKETANRRDISYDLSSYDPETNATEGDKMPNLNQFLSDDQIWDMIKFMKEGMFDVSQLYDATYEGTYPTGSATFNNVGLNGDAANGNTYYTSNCAGCHGGDGTTLEMEGKTLGEFVRSKPNEVQHKVHYGQLGSTMIGKFDITLEQMRDLYKANADETAFP
ncbi:MAG: c-type cytochrome [Bacteroidota bacterium]